MLLFTSTRRFFEAWLQQLANYALVSVLTVFVAALMLEIVQSYAEQTAALGSAILTVDALNMVLAASLVFLVFFQVMPIAARLAGGVSLSGFHFMGYLAARLGTGARHGSVVVAHRLADGAGRARVIGGPGTGQSSTLAQTAWRRPVGGARR